MTKVRKVWWRRLWRRYPRIVGLCARLTLGVWHLKWRPIIDSVFRYLQMITVVTIFTSLIKIVDPVLSGTVKAVLSISAGLYLGIPVGHWVSSMYPARLRNRTRCTAAHNIILFSTALTVVDLTNSTTTYLQALLSATVRIDEDAARKRYAEWFIADRETRCMLSAAHAHIEESTMVKRCFQHREQPIPSSPTRISPVRS